MELEATVLGEWETDMLEILPGLDEVDCSLDCGVTITGTGISQEVTKTQPVQLECAWPAILTLSEDGPIDFSGK
jgi:hypothetical protein